MEIKYVSIKINFIHHDTNIEDVKEQDKSSNVE